MLTDTKIAAIKPPASGQSEHPDHKVTGLRLRVGSGGKKTWTLRRRVGSKVINRKVGSYPEMRLAGARDAAEKMIEALEASGSTEGLDRTFGQVAEHWLETKEKADARNRTIVHQRRQLEMHVLPAWGGRRIASIKRAEARELIDAIEGAILPNRILTLIKTIFRHAMARDWLETSPIEGIEKPKSEKPRRRVLDMPEVAAVWRAAGLLGYPLGPWVQTLLLTAQRGGEVAAMRWADLDLDAATWTLPAETTKADRSQLVPLSPAVVKVLQEQPQMGEYVFTGGEKPVSGFAKGKTRLDSYIASRGDPLKPWRFHDLRRTAATHMVRLGIGETTVSRVLNHAVKGVTAQVYALHSYAPEKRHALDAWAAEVERALGQATGDNVVRMERG